MRLSTTYQKTSAALELVFFLNGMSVAAFAGDIETALSGRTAFEAAQIYRPWRQFFAADGITTYFGDGPSSVGRWEVRGTQYCSLWPPVEEWACYEVELATRNPPFNSIVWISKDGTREGADLFDGDLTTSRVPPKR